MTKSAYLIVKISGGILVDAAIVGADAANVRRRLDGSLFATAYEAHADSYEAAREHILELVVDEARSNPMGFDQVLDFLRRRGDLSEHPSDVADTSAVDRQPEEAG